ncbi:MAG: hypothetical protein QXF04_04075 [Candidatus Aenigmatarchaeota archaeon]
MLWAFELKIKGVHYGLTLLYSYMLPLFEIEETPGGFVFRKMRGLGRWLTCEFNEEELETRCIVPCEVSRESVERVLGLEKQPLFGELCVRLNLPPSYCSVTLLYEPADAKLVFYAVYLSRNTDYYVNTVKWTKQAVEHGAVESTSYIPREFNALKPRIDSVFAEYTDPAVLSVELLKLRGVGAKTVSAIMLHGYGLTEYAPVDRHYADYLGLNPRQPPKSACITSGFECSRCTRSCVYRYAVVKYGVYNGVVQSLTYIRARLKRSRRSIIEEVLVKETSWYLDIVESILEKARELKLTV